MFFEVPRETVFMGGAFSTCAEEAALVTGPFAQEPKVNPFESSLYTVKAPTVHFSAKFLDLLILSRFFAFLRLFSTIALKTHNFHGITIPIELLLGTNWWRKFSSKGHPLPTFF